MILFVKATIVAAVAIVAVVALVLLIKLAIVAAIVAAVVVACAYVLNFFRRRRGRAVRVTTLTARR